MSLPDITEAEAAEIGLSLGPRGPAWVSTRWKELVSGMSAEWATVANKVRQLFDEMFPGTADDMLDDWLASYGIPDECAESPPSTTAEKQAALVAKVRAVGGQTPAYFISVCAAAGYTVTITTYSAFLCDINDCGDALYDATWAYHWHVVGSGGAIPGWLQCIIERRKPAHTTVSFG